MDGPRGGGRQPVECFLLLSRPLRLLPPTSLRAQGNNRASWLCLFELPVLSVHTQEEVTCIRPVRPPSFLHPVVKSDYLSLSSQSCASAAPLSVT